MYRKNTLVYCFDKTEVLFYENVTKLSTIDKNQQSVIIFLINDLFLYFV